MELFRVEILPHRRSIGLKLVSTGCSNGGASSLPAQMMAARSHGDETSSKSSDDKGSVAREEGERSTLSLLQSAESSYHWAFWSENDQNALEPIALDWLPSGAKRSFGVS